MFYDTFDLFFVNFALSTDFSYTILRGKLARVTGKRFTAVFTPVNLESAFARLITKTGERHKNSIRKQIVLSSSEVFLGASEVPTR